MFHVRIETICLGNGKETLKPGETLLVDRTDFNWKKKTPNIFCLRISKASSKRFKVTNTIGRTGWLIERVA